MSNPTKDRVRVTISLSKELAAQIDGIVDGVKIRNRSHAIETLVSDSLDLIQAKQAVVLAGGEHAIDRLPAIEKMLSQLRQQGIFEIIMIVGYLGDKIREEIGTGKDRGMTIEYVESDLGSAGALVQLKHRLRRTFIVVNVEEPVSIDFKSLLRFHRENQPVATVATRSLRDLSVKSLAL